jgi:hypothetical protein
MFVSSNMFDTGSNDTAAKDETEGSETEKKEFPPVPEEAIVKPEEERPAKGQVRPEEKLEEDEADIEYLDTENEDMDGDGSPDWDPAVGPGV